MYEMTDDDAEARLAFQQFMLGSSKSSVIDEREQKNRNDDAKSSSKKKKKKKRKLVGGGGGGATGKPPSTPIGHKKKVSTGTSVGSSKTTATPLSSQQRRDEQRAKNAERTYWRIYKSFFIIVKDEWLDIDTQMENVVLSIDNIRGRLPMENDLINYIREEEEREAKKSWDGYGLGYSTRREHNSALTMDDIRLAMAHDLQQHEKMLAGSRRLLSNLSEVQDALGRKLDDLYEHNIECRRDEYNVRSFSVNSQLLVEEATEVYHQLASELYRKQSLVRLLFESISDEMLEGEEEKMKDVVIDIGGGKKDEGSNMSSKEASALVAKQWPRRSKFGLLDLSLLSEGLRRCEGNKK